MTKVIDNMNTLAERLKHIRNIRGLSQQQVANLAKMAQPSYFKVENGLTLRPRNINDIAKALGVDVDWLIDGVGEPKIKNEVEWDNNVQQIQKFKQAPVLNAVQAGKFTHIGDNQYDEHLPYFGDYGDDNVYWLKIQGDSMVNDFRAGEYVLINTDRQPTAGNYVVALQNEHEKATFKKYRPKGFDENGIEYWHLVPSNPEYPVIDSRFQPFTVLGVAVERNQKLV